MWNPAEWSWGVGNRSEEVFWDLHCTWSSLSLVVASWGGKVTGEISTKQGLVVMVPSPPCVKPPPPPPPKGGGASPTRSQKKPH